MTDNKISLLHKIDPLSKLVVLLCIAVLCMHWQKPSPQIMMLISLIIVACCGARMSLIQLMRRMLYIIIFGIPLFIVSILAVPPEGMSSFEWGEIYVAGNILYALAITVRMFCLFLSSLIYIQTTEVKDFVTVMTTYLRIPYRYVFGISTALTFLPLLASEAKTASEARKIRYGRMPRGIKERIAIWRSSIASVFIGAIRRVEQTAGSMESKGFGANSTRTFLREIQIQLTGYIVICTGVAMTIMLWNI